MKLAKKQLPLWLGILIGAAVLVGLFIYFDRDVGFDSTGVGIFEQTSREEFDAVDTSDWETFEYAAYGYRFLLPPDWYAAETHSLDEEVSTFVPGIRKKMLGLTGPGISQIFIFPEGGFARALNRVAGSAEPKVTKEFVLGDTAAVLHAYDSENMIVYLAKFDEQFRIQVFVEDSDKENWALVEQIFANMDLTERATSTPENI